MSGNGRYPVTKDGRYFVVGGRLWRMTNPSLNCDLKSMLVSELMLARRDVGAALKSTDKNIEAEARRRVDLAKHALGERGTVWWEDGAPDYNRNMVKNAPYARWYSGLGAQKS